MLQLAPYHTIHFNCYVVSNLSYMFTMLKYCFNLSSLQTFIVTPLNDLGISYHFCFSYSASLVPIYYNKTNVLSNIINFHIHFQFQPFKNLSS
jgi:hypothetical protein